MNTYVKLLTTVVVGLLAVAVVPASTGSSYHEPSCAPCTNVMCIPPNPGCERSRRVCSCCDECSVPEGGFCGPYSPACESHLVCLTKEGMFRGHPPLHFRADGKCTSIKDAMESQSQHSPQPRVG